MARVTTIYPEDYRFSVFLDPLSLINFDIATLSDRTSASFTLDAHNNGYVLTVQGTGLRYSSDGLPTQGIITEIHGIQGGTPTYDIADLQLDVAVLIAWFTADRSGPHPLFDGNDTVIGGSGNDTFFGNRGHDVVMGGANADNIGGGSGNDHVYGQSPNGGPDGDDTLSGDEGNDYIQGNAGNDRLSGGDGSDRIYGGAGNDYIFGDGTNAPPGKPGNDTINGNLGNDTIRAGEGNDFVRGGQGNDRLEGDEGNDILMGDKGDDVLIGGAGFDIMTGGEGKDIFSFDLFPNQFLATTGPDAYRTDILTDFTHGEDLFDLAKPNHIYAGQASDAQNALAVARNLVSDHPFERSVAAITVGNDVYMFATSGNNTPSIDIAVLLLNVDAAKITIGDFAY